MKRMKTVIAAAVPAPDAQTARRSEPTTIIPRPKQAEYDDGYARILDGSSLIDSQQHDSDRLSERAQQMLAEWLEHQMPDPQSSKEIPPTRQLSSEQPRLAFTAPAMDEDLPKEGYQLHVSPDLIQIIAGDEGGFTNAVQTLKQLAVSGPDDSLLIRCCSIRDWPALTFRGVHLFTGGKGPALHEKLIENIIAACKLNHIVLEAEYVEWDSHPEIHHPEYGMPKADVRQILATCRSLGIEVTPLVQSLGHCQWMFEHDQNLELAEDPEAKWAYCVTNPKTYEFIFDVFTEAIELFEPRYFHIGHDEFADRGRVPYREESKKYTVEQLLMKDTLRLHEWFAERGIRMMMWGDMFLAKGEAPDACHAQSEEAAGILREQLPDDIIVTDWHYAVVDPEELTSSLKIFERAGHATIASTWYRPANIINFAHAAYRSEALGLLQTTWAGYSLDPQSYQREIHQYEVYVLAAEAAWNADRPPDPDSYRAGWHYYDLTGESTLRPTDRSGRLLQLHDAYNYRLAAGDEDGWFGLGPRHDLSAAPAGDVRLKGIRFALGKARDRSAIVLDGKLVCRQAFPTEINLDTQCAAAALAIVHATNFEAHRGTKIASTR